MTHVDENPTNDTNAEAAPETSTPIRSVATQQWLDAAVEALNRVDVDEALRHTIAQRIF